MVFFAATAAATTTGRMALSRGVGAFRKAAMAPVQNTATKSTQRRAMGGGGHAPAPEWEGIDKVVRGVFPGDHQCEFFVCCVRTRFFIDVLLCMIGVVDVLFQP